MKFVADFHIHSKYSRATSKDMDLEGISKWAKIKGIDLIGTGDFTHPLWLAELKRKLEPLGNGLFKYKGIHFILQAEISNIYSKNGKVRKIHSIVLAPGFEVVDKINKELGKVGNLHSDGRPILGLDVEKLAEIIFSASEDCMLIPAHAWTPHFAVFGSNSGFDSLEEAFGKYTKHIKAIETGLSSDPAMNWRLSKLDNLALVSNSDAHSPGKLGREANVFDCEMDYKTIIEVISKKDKSKFLYTIEFFPQEGKYHFDGHRKCNVCLSPKESRLIMNVCSQCKRKLTIGVMHRVDDLADREEGIVPEGAIPFKSIIPLPEIIAGVLGKGAASKAVEAEYNRMISALGPELGILLDLAGEEIKQAASDEITAAIIKMRKGEVCISAGYDGEYGSVKILGKQAAPLPLFEGL